MTTKKVRVRARVSFHDIRQGEESDVELDSVMQGWINGGFMEVISSAESATGPGSAGEDDSGRLAKRARRGRAARDEQGEGLGAGGHGPVANVDPD